MSEAMIFDGFFSEATTEEGRKAETIKNVLLCGLQSLNGRSIPASAFGGSERAKALYSGCHVYLNHDLEAGPSRRVQELAGVVEKVRVDSLGRPRGDIRLNGNKAGEELRSLMTFATKAETHGAKLKDVGMSHVARYTFSSFNSSTVQSVDEVFSVDVVIRPATTKSFKEGTQPVPHKTPTEFLESLGTDLQTWNDTPIEYAYGEFPTSDERSDSTPNFDVSKALESLDGLDAEGVRFLDSVTFV